MAGDAQFKIAGLFAGIGGIELGFQRALGHDVETLMFCEAWEPAQQVLQAHFPDVTVHPDVRTLTDLPDGTNVVTAGFPCTDLSQAGRTAGITGLQSGLIKHVFEVLGDIKDTGRTLPTLLVENVPNMLQLNKGYAMTYLVQEIERLGYRWAYRVVDSRFTGVPQRRRRVILLASVEMDPRDVLFADDAGERAVDDLADDAFGFYWTEGRGGLGWAQDAVPTLKGGSTIGIPSPPAVWLPNGGDGERFVKPSINDAEAMQGFDRGWTNVEGLSERRRVGTRWKMVGNAVTVGVSKWVAGRMAKPGTPNVKYSPWVHTGKSWPTAAWGENGNRWTAPVSEFPVHDDYQHLYDMLSPAEVEPLTERATRGFLNRLTQGNLGRHPGFRDDVADHLKIVGAS